MSKPILAGEILARALDAASRSLEVDDGKLAHETLKADFEELARLVAPARLRREDVVRQLLQPMRESLAARFAVVDACRIYWAFLDAFWAGYGRSETSNGSKSHDSPTLPDWYDRHLAAIFAGNTTRSNNGRDRAQ